MTALRIADEAAVAEGARLLRAGRLVAFPTETVYGLGANASDDNAVRAIYQAKRRPAHNPLIIHLADPGDMPRLARPDSRAERLAEAFWPGPLTMVLERREDAPISGLATAGLSTVALRVPAHPIAHALLQAAAVPVVAPSANPSGRVSPTTAEHVMLDLGGRIDLILDGGACTVGLESTVVDLSRPDRAVLLRPGGLDQMRLSALLGRLESPAPDPTVLRSPGQLASHYAPRLPLRLEALSVAPDEALLAFGPHAPRGALVTRNLSPSGDLGEAARQLFALLRELDGSGAARIAVMPIPADGLGAAIRDRLTRAAATPAAQPSQNDLDHS